VESDGTLDRNATSSRLAETLAKKAMATIAPGTYALPDAQGPAPFALPLCLLRPNQKPLATGTGTIARRMVGPTRIFDLSLPVSSGVGGGSVSGTLAREGTSPLSGEDLEGLAFCPDSTCAPLARASFLGACSLDGNPTRDVVDLEDGRVELTVTFSRPTPGVIGIGEDAVLSRASGSFRGVPFDQRDYFKLVYSPEHHHFIRHYAVFFDAPVAGACGLDHVHLPGRLPATSRLARVFAVDCQLGRQSEIKVKGVTPAP
jgi:hypothetical protein